MSEANGKEQAIQMLNKRLKQNQILLYGAIVIAAIVLLIDLSNVYWSVLFISIGALSLSNINACKDDKKKLAENRESKVEGTIVDVFPENDKELKWIIFFSPTHRKKIVEEFVVEYKPDVEEGDEVIASYSPKMKYLISLVPSSISGEKEKKS